MEIILWIGFILLVCGLLALDLGVFNKNPHAVSAKEAMGWTAVWVAVAMLFNVFVYFAYEHHLFGIGLHEGSAAMGGQEASLKFFTGYLIEKSLSLDNIFVIAVIFTYFKVPQRYQHEILFWGIVGALVLRAIMIIAGAALVHQFDWIMYVFGALLLWSSYKMLRSSDEEVHPEQNPVLKLVKRFYPVDTTFDSNRFFVIKDGVKHITPMLVVLLVIESTDVMFAVDSIPAIFAVTSDPFIVFTSNIFAILGLRSLYFVLASVLDKFQYLKYSLVFILAFVGVKMLLVHTEYKIPTEISLAAIVLSLAGGVLVSVWKAGRSKPTEEIEIEEE